MHGPKKFGGWVGCKRTRRLWKLNSFNVSTIIFLHFTYWESLLFLVYGAIVGGKSLKSIVKVVSKVTKVQQLDLQASPAHTLTYRPDMLMHKRCWLLSLSPNLCFSAAAWSYKPNRRLGWRKLSQVQSQWPSVSRTLLWKQYAAGFAEKLRSWTCKRP